MTLHWVSEDKLERVSLAIALRRLHGKHDYKSITEQIAEVHRNFDIQNKVNSKEKQYL